ncbi:UDP-N-acetylmuramoyl-L-alanine--D-glutamate ligase [Halomonas sp. McH1-25]|uniref:UDP-N-acetylmuramoyl-L-alanine--D-glutamate ligase n=1 Tax=unclassified Halomonas TaxID=2609666 RepID=UPI001EF436B6|nr:MULTISPECIES: UDP-N-acetylmuramoyl-L-alanine--D-glutamate ligase [unclassified Halomonas]MCG7598959.1 UDP-N-acetylmuramoyl-L-alanine--D-glutamate ligase [Halomonas sp. McH1-25]MCP1342437.1 UDP-N-acetylmuramoyl-L-alanine--D-glutamate ligase [Halomonas sp. FL8]MCP1363466.1 UDP-N-acetylmuramoyl-L-alanine--D-glutamate ligase [Halomonas sp. BBD45]
MLTRGQTLVVGLGVSGQAIARHLTRQGVSFMVADTRRDPPGLDAFRREHPGVAVHCGALSSIDLEAFDEIVLSPGVDPRSPGLAPIWQRSQQGATPRVVGEIALFKRACHAPIAAITGANAKSTVTTLLGEMAREAGVRAAVGGNLGTPALDLLHAQPDAELFVLELSSFQLETTPCLGATTAAFLNLSEDHLDRHGDMAGYRAAKLGIFRGAQHAVVNAEDRLTWPDNDDLPVDRFTTKSPQGPQWGIAVHDDGGGKAPWLMHGARPLMAVDELRLPGRHNQANVLAALAMGTRLGLPMEAMRRVLARFPGLPHRGQLVGAADGVRWVNDSKGTNVGATLAAIDGLGATLEGKLIWLGGGVGKGADFTPLAEPLARHAREAIVFGADAPRLVEALSRSVPVVRQDTLVQALERAASIAQPGDCVLLSPACASLDQFVNYMARGEAFQAWVERYLATRQEGA